MILVRERNNLFYQLFRSLKRAGVPVEGADRITLGEELAVQDLLAIGRFALLPEDDFTLACVLKGPFIGLLDEEADLAPLARAGRRSLWAELLARSEPRYQAAAALLKSVRARAGSLPPFEFFAALLDGRIGPQGETGWALLIGRLGHAAREPVEALLARALDPAEPPASLEAFVHAIERDTRQIKRELGSGATGVRIMTVHGAKGLEAPVVILPDTTAAPRVEKAGRVLLDPDQGLLLWVASGANHTAASRALAAAGKAAREAEDRRLLYVAMTRARDRLLVRGAAVGNATAGRHERSWHAILEEALKKAGATVSDAGATLTLGAPPPPAPQAPALDLAADAAPAWLGASAPAETAARRAAPSALAPGPGGERVLSPLGTASRFRRGEAIHDLLQRLPDLPEAVWEEAAQRRLAAYPEASPEERTAWAHEALAVLRHPAFAAVFGPGSRAEVPVVGGGRGLPEDLVVNGAIDRLLVTQAEVLAVDFKTNRPPPLAVEDVAPAYLAQMAAYRAVLQRVFPGRPVRCALIWTDGPRLMELPQAALDAALRGPLAAPTSDF
jgi:ATP-dependent helicase/nuclease subunit A